MTRTDPAREFFLHRTDVRLFLGADDRRTKLAAADQIPTDEKATKGVEILPSLKVRVFKYHGLSTDVAEGPGLDPMKKIAGTSAKGLVRPPETLFDAVSAVEDFILDKWMR